MMRLPRPRLTVRRLMIVVAMSAVLLAAEKMRRIRQERMSKATEYTSSADAWLKDVKSMQGMMDVVRARNDDASAKRLADLSGMVDNFRRNERRDRESASRYSRAAARPWLPFEADPPAPE